jgi:shikimate kinase
MTNVKNVILIGMPGCGKSTVGVVLAKLLGYNFVDVDLLIQRKHHCRLQTLIDQRGNQAFLDLEADTIACLDCQETVIATGGSAALHPVGVDAMKKLGVVVYLQHPCQEIIQRIPNLESRGITLEKGQTLEDLYAYRTPIYESVADVTIDAAGLTVEETALKVEQALLDWEQNS